MIISSMKKIFALGLFFVALSSAAGYLYSIYFDKDTYTSYSQLIVLNPKSSNQASDYASIAKSRTVLEAVQLNSDVNQSLESLQANVKAANTPGTNIISIEAIGSSPEESRQIALVVSSAIGNQAEKLYSENNTSIVDEASLGTLTHENNPVKTTLIGAAAGLVISVMLAFIFYEPKRHTAVSDSDLETTPPYLDEINEVIDYQDQVDIKPVGHKYAASRGFDSRINKPKNTPQRKI